MIREALQVRSELRVAAQLRPVLRQRRLQLLEAARLPGGGHLAHRLQRRSRILYTVLAREQCRDLGRFIRHDLAQHLNGGGE